MHEPEDPETAPCPPASPVAASGLAPAYVAAAPLSDAEAGAPTLAASLVDPPEPTPAVHALLVMLDSATDFGVVQLENALGALMRGPAPTSAEQRVAELSALAHLLESELAVTYARHRVAPVQVSQRAYDATRPLGAPTAETLIKRHGSEKKDGWSWACRAAWGLLPDGRKTKPGCGWASGLRGRKRLPRSDRDLVIRSIRECAFELLRRPSSNVYIEWLAAHRRRADSGPGGGRASNPHRRASMPAVYQQFPRGWMSALAAADITDAELADARAKLVAERSPAAAEAAAVRAAASAPTSAQRLASLDAHQLASLGLDERTRDRLVRKGFVKLRVSQAAGLAHALSGSLEWLVGTASQPGEPADPATRFDPDALRAAAKRSDIKLEALRAKAQLDISGWRAVMTLKREPTLAQIQRWTHTTRTQLDELCREQRADKAS